MWAEDDMVAGELTVLQSQKEPTANNVYKMYHGTSKAAAEKILQEGFRQSADGMFGRGVYLSRDLEKASKYPLDKDLGEDQKVVLRVKVNVGKVIAITYQGHPYQKTWHDHGYDTAWCPPKSRMVKSGQEEDCVWDPSRITIIDVIPSRLGKEPQEGRVYRMYHGTSREAAEKIKREGFHQSADGMLGRGVYLSRDLEKASRYPRHLAEHQKVVLRVMVKVGKVIRIDYQGHPHQKTWHNHGYDTAWCPPCDMVPSGLEEDCVWDPTRITVIGVIRANMWAEDDLGAGAPPCLNSYIEPQEGKIYRMYHGTTREAAEKIKASGFKQSTKGMLGRGVYLSRDLQKASRYPLHLPEDQRVVLRVKVNVGKVKKIDSQTHPMRTTWHDHGYDTAWCPPNCGMVSSGLEEDCVWDPRRISIIGEIRPKRGLSGAHFLSYTQPEKDQVYLMCHGTSRAAAAKIWTEGFHRSLDGMLGTGVYLSRDLKGLIRYPLLSPVHQIVVLRCKVKVGKVKKIDRQGHPLQKTWHCKGYDTAINSN
ncbi:hypothetical protein IRJ41_005415 [Triplophysa rosa]|uniref:PARP catalytic domain-containing protein n=1 Tax=Triplophysa rosa TaxID=992332 RepID=A0A9W7TGP9_TRIRA|nr:hypothetical protein IRJ41_005415 [Triplophysa rosa]